MDVVEAITRLGGVAATHRLIALTSRRRVATAARRGRIVRDSRGHYALPGADEALRAANRLHGVVTGPSAAAAHGWETKVPPTRPDITVPAKRRVAPDRRRGVDLHWRDIDHDDVSGGVLRAGPTVIDCAKKLPFDEALAIVDSALRHGNVTAQQLLRLAEQVPSTGRAQCLRVARVLRFSWEHVMHEPDYVRECLVRIAGGAVRQETLVRQRRMSA